MFLKPIDDQITVNGLPSDLDISFIPDYEEKCPNLRSTEKYTSSYRDLLIRRNAPHQK